MMFTVDIVVSTVKTHFSFNMPKVIFNKRKRINLYIMFQFLQIKKMNLKRDLDKFVDMLFPKKV